MKFPNSFKYETDLSFNEVIAVSVARCARWHPGGVEDWSLSDWSNATFGELGEAANIIKKLRRVEDRLANHNDRGRNIRSAEQARKKLGKELADTFLYLILLSVKARVHLPDEIIDVFNKKSKEYKFPERLPIKGSRGLYQKRA